MHVRRACALPSWPGGVACTDQDHVHPYVHEGLDGYDVQEWIGAQPWSTGKIGTSGGSDLGLTQWIAAPHANKHLTCMVPRVIGADQYTGLFYPGGAFQLFVIFNWIMRNRSRTAQPDLDPLAWREAMRTPPLRMMDRHIGRDLPYWKDWIDHAAYDAYWDHLNVEPHWGQMTAPAFNMGGWYDIDARETFINYNGLVTHGSAAARQSKLTFRPPGWSVDVSFPQDG